MLCCDVMWCWQQLWFVSMNMCYNILFIQFCFLPADTRHASGHTPPSRYKARLWSHYSQQIQGTPLVTLLPADTRHASGLQNTAIIDKDWARGSRAAAEMRRIHLCGKLAITSGGWPAWASLGQLPSPSHQPRSHSRNFRLLSNDWNAASSNVQIFRFSSKYQMMIQVESTETVLDLGGELLLLGPGH